MGRVTRVPPWCRRHATVDAGASSALFQPSDIIALPGGVAIKRGNEIVAGLGVGGAPGGDRDEACAQEGVAKIAARVNANPSQ